MGTMKIHSPESDVLGHTNIRINDPQIIKGIWLDKDKRKPITEAYLGQTVIFSVTTKNIHSNSTLLCRLFDDEKCKFDGSDTFHARYSSNDIAEFELELKSYWGYDLLYKYGILNLYCEVSYSNMPKIKLPVNNKDYLRISPALLYMMYSDKDSTLPDMYTDNGEPISISEASGLIKDALSDQISDINQQTYKYFLTKIKTEKIKIKALNYKQNILAVLDSYGGIIDLAKIINSGGKSVSELTLPLVGPLAPLAIPADLIVTDFCNNLRIMDNMAELRVMEAAKKKGLNAVYRFIDINDKYQEKYTIMHVKSNTALEIIEGKYHSIKEFYGDGDDAALFIRKISTAKISDIYIIESIYWSV